jgi:hypothetical protein
MKRVVIAATMSFFMVSLAAISSADTLTLRDGTQVQGTVLGIVDGTITFRHADGESRWYPTGEVEALWCSTSSRSSSTGGPTSSAPRT